MDTSVEDFYGSLPFPVLKLPLLSKGKDGHNAVPFWEQ